jgi:hypothetical protein
MTEPARFDSRPWTQADDDKLRQLKSDWYPDQPTETAVRSRARQLQVILRKIWLEQLQMG